MEHLIELANQFVIYFAGYSLILIIYGFIIYNLVKFVLYVLTNAYKAVRLDIRKWRAGKEKEKRNTHDNL